MREIDIASDGIKQFSEHFLWFKKNITHIDMINVFPKFEIKIAAESANTLLIADVILYIIFEEYFLFLRKNILL